VQIVGYVPRQCSGWRVTWHRWLRRIDLWFVRLLDPIEPGERLRWFEFVSLSLCQGRWLCDCGNRKRIAIRKSRLIVLVEMQRWGRRVP